MARKIILVELNEVPGRIVDEYRAAHPRSHLARAAPAFDEWETFAEDRGHLSPWITWPSLHRGVDNTRHGIFAFGQDRAEADRSFPPLWEITQAQGASTGVCGSLHSYGDLSRLDRYAFFIPDTFAAGNECFPQTLTPFQEFNLAMARESARNVKRSIVWRAAWAMLRQAPSLGLRLSTLADVGRQLLDERLHPPRVVRRRTYQGTLAFDVFFKQLRRTEPQFATFFTNHVAAAMHRYWAARFPGDYDRFGYRDEWVRTYGDEIDFAMAKFDCNLGDLLRFVRRRPDYELWIATSMGQAATRAEPIDRELQLVNLEKFMTAAGVPAGGWLRRPAMLPQVNVVPAEEHRAAFRGALSTLSIGDRPLEFAETAGGFFSITVGVADPDERRTLLRRSGSVYRWDEFGLAPVEIADRTGITAYHIPEGLLLRYDPRRAGTARMPSGRRPQISTLEIAPRILQRLGLAVPAYMQLLRTAAA